jgi:hypothetical protein
VQTLVQQAREAHRKSVDLTGASARHRERRDELIRRAYGLGTYSYSQLAKQVGCSVELVAKIVQQRT